MAVILYCGHQTCGQGFSVIGEIPMVCPVCQRDTKWIVAPFPLNENDRRFLKSLRIAAE